VKKGVGISSKLAGGTFEDGFRNGLISAGLNHGLHALAAELQNNHNLMKSGLPKPQKLNDEAYLELTLSAKGVSSDYAEQTLQIKLKAAQTPEGNLYWDAGAADDFLLKGQKVQGSQSINAIIKSTSDNVMGESYSFRYDVTYNGSGGDGRSSALAAVQFWYSGKVDISAGSLVIMPRPNQNYYPIKFNMYTTGSGGNFPATFIPKYNIIFIHSKL
jgi:hypothetical protein